jgi:uncharacterized membrane protein
MDDVLNQIANLSKQLDNLRSRQLQMNNEMSTLEKQLTTLAASVSPLGSADEAPEPVLSSIEEQKKPSVKYLHQVKQQLKEKERKNIISSFHVTQELEDFIGTNLISKIGILITIIGVFIGAKYAIDKELISPAMRIILSYLFAAALFFVALRLKPKYENFSSILMAGGLAVTYFVTYIAFSFYQLFPQGVAFAMMIITTMAAVFVSLWYNLKVIALIGQVAAYAIPFLLGDGSGNVSVLLTYISIINIGLLVLSFKKDWKILYHIAFFLTWIIYAFWIVSSNNTSTKFSTGLLFLSINFFTFYVTFLSYKIIRKQIYKIEEIVILLLNALFFFFLGTYLIDESFNSHRQLTWFTLSNAAIHFVVGYLVYRLKLTDKTVFRFILGLGLLFVTVSIPIEFDGSWVTLLWTVEATTLFYIASSNEREMYLKITFPLAIISLLSLLQDWSLAYPHIKGIISNKITIRPFSNLNFWLSLFVCSCFGYMSYHSPKNILPVLSVNIHVFFGKVVPVIFIVLLYFSFYNELHLVWDLAIQQSQVSGARSNYHLLRTVTLLVFSCLYIAAFIWVNFKWIKRADINSLLLTVAGVVNLVMIFKGLYVLGELRDNYLQHQLASPSFSSIISVRYFFFIALAILWISAWQVIKAKQISASIQVFFSLFFNFTFLSIICNEFVHWMDLSGYSNQYKLGLSIICGMYALAIVFAGIIKKKKHLRIGGIFLFGLTLLKLFFYDLSSLSAISKTIVLLMLGILLLVASFLYNKYKGLLFTKED